MLRIVARLYYKVNSRKKVPRLRTVRGMQDRNCECAGLLWLPKKQSQYYTSSSDGGTRTRNARLLRPVCLPVAPRRHSRSGGSRTPNIRSLKPARLPIASRSHGRARRNRTFNLRGLKPPCLPVAPWPQKTLDGSACRVYIKGHAKERLTVSARRSPSSSLFGKTCREA
jgi:hypothetical protein